MTNYLALYWKNKPLWNTFRRQRQSMKWHFGLCWFPNSKHRQLLMLHSPNTPRKGCSIKCGTEKEGPALTHPTPHSNPTNTFPHIIQVSNLEFSVWSTLLLEAGVRMKYQRVHYVRGQQIVSILHPYWIYIRCRLD